MKTAKDLKIPFVWADRHPILLEKFFYLPTPYPHGEKSFPFFEKEQPVVIEYCSGNGQWIGERALQNPHLNWIAVEKRFERARKIWLKIFRENIPNLCVVCGEALLFTRYYAPFPVSEIYVNFPDPWPKRRHGKNRLVEPEFLQELLRIVPSGGRATCVTDDAHYASEMSAAFAQCPAWTLLFHSHEWPDYGRSYFKDLWLQKGRAIHYLSYERGPG